MELFSYMGDDSYNYYVLHCYDIATLIFLVIYLGYNLQMSCVQKLNSFQYVDVKML